MPRGFFLSRPALRLALRPALRLAWRARNAWHRLTRPVTLGVRVIVLEGGEPARVLLVRHSYLPGWHLPGGGVGRGETLAAAARRETREEAGLTLVEPLETLGVFARFRHGASDHVAVFAARSWSGTPRADGFEILETGFFALESLPDATSPATRRRLAEFQGLADRALFW